MATAKITPGTAFQGPDGQVAVKMGPAVSAGQYFVIHPDNGGHYTDENEVKGWPQLSVSESEQAKADAAAAEAAAPAVEPTPAPVPAANK